VTTKDFSREQLVYSTLVVPPVPLAEVNSKDELVV